MILVMVLMKSIPNMRKIEKEQLRTQVLLAIAQLRLNCQGPKLKIGFIVNKDGKALEDMYLMVVRILPGSMGVC